METRIFEDSDLETVSGWLTARNIPSLRPDRLPPRGLIVEGLATGFLIATDANYAIIDFLISNPKGEFGDRQRAITLIVNELSDMAKGLGFEVVIGYTSDLSVAKTIKRHCDWQEGELKAEMYKYLGEAANG